ncbi:MAG: hypothetical protein PHG63_02065 [Candidatus Dojkabacteria bacterium]|nr:hypothetical protein [Candidatus Dojkabacteria bacterium]
MGYLMTKNVVMIITAGASALLAIIGGLIVLTGNGSTIFVRASDIRAEQVVFQPVSGQNNDPVRYDDSVPGSTNYEVETDGYVDYTYVAPGYTDYSYSPYRYVNYSDCPPSKTSYDYVPTHHTKYDEPVDHFTDYSDRVHEYTDYSDRIHEYVDYSGDPKGYVDYSGGPHGYTDYSYTPPYNTVYTLYAKRYVRYDKKYTEFKEGTYWYDRDDKDTDGEHHHDWKKDGHTSWDKDKNKYKDRSWYHRKTVTL